MSSLYKRGKYWWFQFLGKRESTRCTDRKAAELAAREIERRRTDPTYRPTNHTTLSQALKKYVAAQTERGKAPGTLKMYDRHIRHIARVLGGNTLLASIEAPEIDRFTSTRLGEGAKRSSVGKELSTIRGTLKLARRHKEYPHPLDEVMPNGFGLDYKPGTAHLREPEVRKLLAALPPRRRAVVSFIVATGADWVSVELAQRGDVNLKAGTVLVRGTKNRHRHRTIPIAPGFHDLLAYAVRHLPFEPWGNVRRDLEVACRRAKVPRITPRDLRRTHGSILRQKGVEPHLIAKMLGHADSRMVEKVYGQLPPDALGDLLRERLTGTAESQTPQIGSDRAPGSPQKSRGSA
jgi:integrase